MSDVRIIPVSTRREQRDFLELPWRLYQGDPNWIPPLRMEQRGLVGLGRHPFHQQANVQALLAVRGNDTPPATTRWDVL